MVFIMKIERRKAGEREPRLQSFAYETQDLSETIATVLTKLKQKSPLKDIEGNEALPINWESSCLQRKCGACAMVINGRPRLACDARLQEYAGKKKRDKAECVIALGPLKKFPLVSDLVTDRSIMQENLRQMRLWLAGEAAFSQKSVETAYEASRCLQCGLCLEVCPNYSGQNGFTGLAGAVPAGRVLSENAHIRGSAKNGNEPEAEAAALRKAYRKMVYEGCGKSLACRDICPAGIDAEHLLARSGAIAVWGRRKP